MALPLEQQQWYQQFLNNLSPEQALSIHPTPTNVAKAPLGTPLNTGTSIAAPSASPNSGANFDDILGGARGLFDQMGTDVASGMSSASQFMGGDINMDGQIDGNAFAELGTSFNNLGQDIGRGVSQFTAGDYNMDGQIDGPLGELKTSLGNIGLWDVAKTAAGFLNPALGFGLSIGDGLMSLAGKNNDPMNLSQSLQVGQAINRGDLGRNDMVGAALGNQAFRNSMQNFSKAHGFAPGFLGGTSAAAQNAYHSTLAAEAARDAYLSGTDSGRSYSSKQRDAERAANRSISAQRDTAAANRAAGKFSSTGGYDPAGPNGGGSNSGSGGGTVICTELHRQGLIPHNVFRADQRFGLKLLKSDPDVITGYHLWAKPIARAMAKSKVITKVVQVSFGEAWAREMAVREGMNGLSTVRGRLLVKFGVPICRALGKLVRFKEQGNKQWLTNN